jgi:hypothetical protein
MGRTDHNDAENWHPWQPAAGSVAKLADAPQGTSDPGSGMVTRFGSAAAPAATDRDTYLVVHSGGLFVIGAGAFRECIRNAEKHVANRREVAVIGTRSSICSKIQVPILNKATDGPMLMVRTPMRTRASPRPGRRASRPCTCPAASVATQARRHAETPRARPPPGPPRPATYPPRQQRRPGRTPPAEPAATASTAAPPREAFAPGPVGTRLSTGRQTMTHDERRRRRCDRAREVGRAAATPKEPIAADECNRQLVARPRERLSQWVGRPYNRCLGASGLRGGLR